MAALYYTAGILGSTLLLMIYYLRTIPSRNLVTHMRFAEVTETLAKAFPFAIGAFITQVNYNFGTFALGLYLTHKEVGVFSASYKIILFMWAFVVVAASNAILPLLVKTYREDKARFLVATRKIAQRFLLVGIGIGAGGTAVGDRVIQFLYSSTYEESSVVLQLGMWIVTVVMLRVVFENALIASGAESVYSKGFLLAGALTLIGNLALVSVAGILSPILVSLIVETFLLIFFLVRSQVLSASSLVNMSIRPVLAAVIMALTITALPFHILLLIPAGALIYFALLLTFRCISIQEVGRIVGSLIH